MKDIKISVVITTYNRKYEVCRALKTVYCQKEKPWEVILIDDASQDGTKELVESQGYSAVKYVYLDENVGVGAARNIGIHLASGDYIAFLDSDNEWKEDKLKCILEVLHCETERYDVVCSRYWQHKYFEKYMAPICPKMGEMDIQQALLIYNLADASASIYHREFLLKNEGFSEKYLTNIDWELLLRASSRDVVRLKYIDNILSENWVMYNGLSQNKEIEYQERLQIIGKYQELLMKQEVVKKLVFEELIDAYKENTPIEKIEYDYLKCHDFSYEAYQVIQEYHSKQEEKLKEIAERRTSFYNLLSKWMELKFKGVSVADSLIEKGYKNVAIYGAGKHGKFLLNDLKGSKINICYLIDKNTCLQNELGFPVYSMKDDLPKVDVIIITPYLEMKNIQRDILNKGDYNILGLDSLIQ